MIDAKEEWRTIAKWPEYEVSDRGRVRRAKGKRLMTTVCYVKVGLQKPGGGGREWPLVHKLVAEAFHGARPSKGHVVNHKNGTHNDNRAENLEWATYQENTQHAVDTGLFSTRGERHSNALLTDEQVREIRAAYTGVWGQQKALGKRYGVSSETIGSIVRAKNWGHMGGAVEITVPTAAHRNAVLTPEQAVAILGEYRGSIRGELARLATKYGVRRSVISNLVHGKSWMALREGKQFVLPTPRQFKLTNEQIAEIRARYTGARSEQSALAREYGVTRQRINKIVLGKTNVPNAAAGAVA